MGDLSLLMSLLGSLGGDDRPQPMPRPAGMPQNTQYPNDRYWYYTPQTNPEQFYDGMPFPNVCPTCGQPIR